MQLFDTIDDAIADSEIGEALYEMYYQEMPYGTAKARDGDPDTWISDHLARNPDEVERVETKLNIRILEEHREHA